MDEFWTETLMDGVDEGRFLAYAEVLKDRPGLVNFFVEKFEDPSGRFKTMAARCILSVVHYGPAVDHLREVAGEEDFTGYQGMSGECVTTAQEVREKFPPD